MGFSMSAKTMTLLHPLAGGHMRHAPKWTLKLGQLRAQASLTNRSYATGGESKPLEGYGALLLDVGGTLLETAQPVPEVYARIGAKHGVKTAPANIKKGFKKAFAEPWPERLRYEGDGRPFWRYAVATATGCSDEKYFEELYQHFARGDAWKIASGAPEALRRLHNAGVKLAVVSNFDSRLRPVLRDLQIDTLFDALIISAEVGYEKPSREIFQAALNELDVDASAAVHVGDDPTNDKQGALAAGLESWLWKVDVKSFEELADRVLQPARFVP
ncbi:uncharacterized protein [Physcomitrium patens]|uniref:Haloacid dehalogenase-like hydrolase domain-containing protein 3 n=1 Tax=Physcomitrium patens TaxID=3218 RepID=A0A2K1J586_PHYPA|nr:haloacid dehalogenase-like hydrolase domain-containing protein 3 isoform X2 [Physcomitrium patens]PNR36694.1 hypothetical protein PHYPA_022545 [Physcomitrium patens]|eukprot:XP_024401029.1 haloacid dehalogenase-like hydrolase domain-containing protein 3 isoform X2 [Physcomitrella patens]